MFFFALKEINVSGGFKTTLLGLGGRLNSIKKDNSLQWQVFSASQSKATFTRRSLENKTYSTSSRKMAISRRSLPEKGQAI